MIKIAVDRKVNDGAANESNQLPFCEPVLGKLKEGRKKPFDLILSISFCLTLS